ncbi:MAG: hypothetical protein K5768_08770 [Firmicutes bacterium]|nr:hypothetical protein [Bacillota bacterium]
MSYKKSDTVKNLCTYFFIETIAIGAIILILWGRNFFDSCTSTSDFIQFLYSVGFYVLTLAMLFIIPPCAWNIVALPVKLAEEALNMKKYKSILLLLLFGSFYLILPILLLKKSIRSYN